MDAVLKILGEDNISILYYHLERLGVKSDEIPRKPGEFSRALRVIFGQGAAILEKQIVSSILSSAGLQYDEELTLEEALKRLQA